MEDSKVQRIAEEAQLIRSKDPTSISLRALIQLLRERVGWVPTRSNVRDALSESMPDAAGWISDLNEAPIGATDSLAALESWITAGALDDEARRQLEPLFAAEAAESPTLHLARLLGVIEGEPHLEVLSPASFPKVLGEAALSAAIRADKVEWVIDSVCFSSPPLPKVVKEGLASVEPDRLEAVCAERLETWPGRIASEPVYAEAFGRLLQVASLCKGLVVAKATLSGVSVVAPKTPVPKWLNSALALAASDPNSLRQAMNQLEEPVVRRLLAAVSRAPLTEDSPRRHLLIAVAESTQRNLLSEPNVWYGVKIDVLADMLELQQVGEIIESVADQTVVAPLVDREAAVAPAWRVLAIAGRWRRVARHVTIRHLQSAYRRDDVSAQLLRKLVAVESQDLLSSIESLKGELVAAEQNRQSLESSIGARDTEIARLHQEETDLRQALVRQSQASRSALEVEINQGRIDTLRTLCAAAESTRTLVAFGGDAGSAAAGLLKDLLRQLDEFGVTVVGSPGERRPARADLDENFAAEATVEVVSPAYVIAGAVTPLRRSFVRVVEGNQP